MELWRLIMNVEGAYAPFISTAMDDHFLSISWFEQEDRWRIEAVSAEKPSSEFVNQILESVCNTLGIEKPIFEIELVPSTDWLEQTWKNFPTRRIGNFYIYGSHHQELPPKDAIALHVDAATAFGSGEHETTTGCLLFIEELAKAKSYKKVLDMGCGSGILAIAAAKIWEIPVVAADNDPESVRVTSINAQLNNCHLTPLLSAGFDNTVVSQDGPYELILANILAKPLCDLAVSLLENLNNEGLVILSGLLEWQRLEVLQAYEKAGAHLVAEKNINNWVTLLMRKN